MPVPDMEKDLEMKLFGVPCSKNPSDHFPVMATFTFSQVEDSGTQVEDSRTQVEDSGTLVEDSGTLVENSGTQVEDSGT